MNLQNQAAEATALVELFTAHDPLAIIDHLSPDDFTRDDYRAAFDAMRQRIDAGATIRGDVELAAIMGPIQGDSTATLRGKALTRTLKQLTQRRKLHAAVMAAADKVADFGTKPADALEFALAQFEDARDPRVAGCKLSTIKDATERFNAKFETAVNADEAERIRLAGYTTGMPWLDHLDGLKPGNLLCIGGRTGTGKTALAITMARGMIEQGIRVCYLCREMRDVDLVQRLAAQLSGEDGRNFDRGKLTVPLNDYVTAIRKMRNHGDALVIGQPKTLAEAMKMAKTARDRHQSQVFIFDYVQQFRVPSAQSPREATMQVTDALKFFALENSVVCIGLAQFNRTAVNATQKPVRPRVHHFKESGSIEEDSDRVWLLWNPVNEDKAIDKGDDPGEILISCDLANRRLPLDKRNANGDTRCALYCDKYRGGECYRAVLSYNGPRTEFYPEPQTMP